MSKNNRTDVEELRSHPTWLPEPVQTDGSYARRGEHTLDWLARSTNSLSREYRRFLYENLSKFPVGAQENFRRRLRSRWYDTLFELIVARILQEMGAEVSFEIKNRKGKCPDFIARFADTPIIVEAVSPGFNPEVEDEAKHRIPLLDIIESNTPDGWQVAVWEIPEIGPSDSKSEFTKSIGRLLDLPPPTDASQNFELALQLSTGLIRLHLWPSGSRDEKIIVEPALTAWGDSEMRIKNAMRRKRKQVRDSDWPVILAIHNSSIVCSFEDYDIALFGRTCERRDQQNRREKTSFQQTGILNEKRNKAPTFAGVLAFLQMGVHGGVAPVFYQHSRFSGILPQAILELEVRSFDQQADCISVKESKSTDLIQGLRCVRL